MPTNDREVFEALTNGAGQPSAVDFLTYALFAFERREWITHKMASNGGHAPTQAEIDAWITDISPSQFEPMRSRAVGTFDVAARAYMADDIEQARQDTLRTAVVREVKAAGNFWRQLFIALATAILAPLSSASSSSRSSAPSSTCRRLAEPKVPWMGSLGRAVRVTPRDSGDQRMPLPRRSILRTRPDATRAEASSACRQLIIHHSIVDAWVLWPAKTFAIILQLAKRDPLVK